MESGSRGSLDSSYLGAPSDLIDLPPNIFEESLEIPADAASAAANAAGGSRGDLQSATPMKISK